MKFKVGQTVKLINNDSMKALLGATAIIKSINNEFLRVQWKTDFNFQAGGSYFLNRFKPVIEKNQQLEFSFMGK